MKTHLYHLNKHEYCIKKLEVLDRATRHDMCYYFVEAVDDEKTQVKSFFPCSTRTVQLGTLCVKFMEVVDDENTRVNSFFPCSYVNLHKRVQKLAIFSSFETFC